MLVVHGGGHCLPVQHSQHPAAAFSRSLTNTLSKLPASFRQLRRRRGRLTARCRESTRIETTLSQGRADLTYDVSDQLDEHPGRWRQRPDNPP